MTTQELIDLLGLKPLSTFEHREVNGVFLSDMLSDVMAGAKSGNLWITVQTHKNIVPAANLVDVAAVVVTGGKDVPQDTIDLASKHGRHIGPLVNATQFEKVQSLIQTGIDEGARLLAGGAGRPEGFNRGYFVRPTVFADVTPDMTVFKEEIFGPIAPIFKFSTEEEAIEMANETKYGLQGAAFTSSLRNAFLLGEGITCGTVMMVGPRSKRCPPRRTNPTRNVAN